MINETTIREVSERSNCVQVVGRYVELKKAGTLYKGLCPFHDEKTPSFTVSPIRNTYHCFGCGAHGDAIRFTMEVGGRSFPEAIRELAEEHGIEIVEDKGISPQRRQVLNKERDERKRLYEVQDRVAQFFTDMLFSSGGKPAQSYLQRRGIAPNSARAFRLGYCPANPTALDQFIKSEGIEIQTLITLGIVASPSQGLDPKRPLGGAYVRFKNRLVCAIVDIKDQVCGFSCRLLDDAQKMAKYVNSPETPIFIKSEQLYGASTAKKPSRQANSVIVCEGNLDVITLWEYGFQASVAVMGTALSDFQGLLLKRMAQDVTVIMDGDAAGMKAAFSGLGAFLRAGLQPRAVLMPQGEDPDSYLRQNGADALSARIEEAKPLLEIFMDSCMAKYPNDGPGHLGALREIAPILADLGDELARKLYIQRLQTQLGLSSDLIESALNEAIQKGMRKDTLAQDVKPPRRIEPPKDAANERAITFSTPLPPPPEFDGFTGPDTQNFVEFDAAKSATVSFPGYLSQIIGFILQFPSISLDFHRMDGHKFLTQKALIGFLGDLRQSVAEGQTPNVDRILSTMTCSQTVAFLRSCQAQIPIADEDAVRSELPKLIKKLSIEFLMGERKRLQQALKTAFRSHGDHCEGLRKELREVQTRLAAQQRMNFEGAR